MLGLAVLAAALLGLAGGPRSSALPSPAVLVVEAAAGPQTGPPPGDRRSRRRARPGAAGSTLAAWREAFSRNAETRVSPRWVAGFYPLYEGAQRAFGVNWLLLASVHRQETAFSTAAGTYRGLNFARCCAGPMQFNVTNGPQTTWERFRHAFRRAERPVDYPNRTARHPSVYDDFDAIMAAGQLLRASGAGRRLDAGAWRAAYDYYGHDLAGVDYANQVVARAIEWSQRSFAVNRAGDAEMVAAVDAAWGAPVRAALRAREASR